MKVRDILLVVVAFLLGAFAAGSIGVRVIREVETTDEATSLPPAATSTTQPGFAPYQVDPNETLISSTALVPTAVEAADGTVRISYELTSLAPRSDIPGIESLGGFGFVNVIEPTEFDHIYPRTWVLTTTRGEVEGGPANVSSRSARFEVDEDFLLDTVEEVSITEAFAPYPVEIPFELSTSEPVVEIATGVDVELLNVSDQGATTIVQIGIDVADPDLASFFVRGDGSGWRSAVFEAEGRRRVNLTWANGPVPNPIPLVALGTVMVPLEGPFDVSVEGFGAP